jgi:MazG family protein
VVFHAEIERQKGRFDFDDVAEAINRKLIRRHPHVFGTRKVRGPADVVRNWDVIKKAEKTGRRYLMDKVPRSLPPLSRCRKILDVAYKAGFKWKKPADVPKKLREEVGEFLANIRSVRTSAAELEKEFGDILFVLVNIARDRGVDPELSLNRTNNKFIGRFNRVEAELGRRKKKFGDVRFAELLALYRKAKSEAE